MFKYIRLWDLYLYLYLYCILQFNVGTQNTLGNVYTEFHQDWSTHIGGEGRHKYIHTYMQISGPKIKPWLLDIRRNKKEATAKQEHCVLASQLFCSVLTMMA